MHTPTELANRYRASGRKVTPQRLAVFAALQGDCTHPSAERVFEAVRGDMPTISLRTVYQTLNDLADLGELGRIDLGTGATRFDPNLAAHHHSVCNDCGTIADVFGDPTADTSPQIEDIGALAPDVDGFVVSSTEIIFRGLCRSCQEASTHTP